MTTLAQDLGGVVLLPCPWCGEELTAVRVSEGSTFRWRKVDGCCTDGPEVRHDTMADDQAAAEIDSTSRAIAAWNTRAHSAEIAGALRDAERWQPIESAPRDGSYILVCNSHGSWIAKYQHFYPSGYRPSSPWASMMLNHDHIEKPGRLDHPTHWRPLPAPPTQDSAMQQGGGGE